jgi:predicted nucleic acid-binding protein
MQALRRNWFAGRIDDAAGTAAVRVFRHKPILRYAVAHLSERIWSLRRNVSAYDASYVALAEQLNLPLITRDRRLSRSSGHGVRIEYID